MTVDEALEIVEKVLDYDRLNKVQEIVFCQSWEGLSYSEIAASAGYEPDYIKQVGFHLWKSLSKAFGKKVTKNNFQSVLKRYAQHNHTKLLSVAKTDTGTLRRSDAENSNGHNAETIGLRGGLEFGEAIAKQIATASLTTRLHQVWGEAIDVSVFFGRTQELALLEQWIIQEHCRLVTVLGMGGIGKTALSVKLVQEIQSEFEYLIWRSLRNAPSIQDLLAELIQFLSQGQETDLPETVDGRVLRLIEYLRSSRCLMILDNAETILCKGKCLTAGDRHCTGDYREGYEGYGQLLRYVAETGHHSCLVLTSRKC